MKLSSLIIENFGVFSSFQIDFPSQDKACVLLTGRNNAGKSTIIRSLKLLSGAMRFASGFPKAIDRELLKKDTADIQIELFIHNHTGDKAKITGILDTGREISVLLDSERNRISCHLPAHTKSIYQNTFGFIPPLGQLAEVETSIESKHMSLSIDTTLAPRHFRNHLQKLLNQNELALLKKIIRESWDGIELQNVQFDAESNRLYCLYSDNGRFREIAYSGQGLQIWMQIAAHMIRLSDRAMLVLDEPEIFLHPQKQHELIEMLVSHYSGDIVIATHSPELMSCVDITHIVNVKSESSKPKILPMVNRRELERIRSHIGSNFNLIASQFDDIELLLATESESDYKIISRLASEYGIQRRTQNIPIGGFQKYKDCALFRDAYKTFFGKEPACSLLLDSDYYPQVYLDEIKMQVIRQKVKLEFTPGKEIENLFLEERFLQSLIPQSSIRELGIFLDRLYEDGYNKSLARYMDFYQQHSTHGVALSTTIEGYKPIFDNKWADKDQRHNLIAGKEALARVRAFLKSKFSLSVTNNDLIHSLVHWDGNHIIKELVLRLYEK